jgi:C-terminal processing protease CtpA/Prc
LQQLIDEANQSLDSESSSYNHNPQVILLNRDSSSTGSTGIILAGGADHETKEISVHKIISGSLADRDGRMRRGDRVISINGKIIKGYTRQAALDILRSPRPQVVIVISRPTDEQLLAQQTRLTSNYAFGSRSDLSNVKVNGTSPSELGVINDQSLENSTPKNYKTLIVTLHKDGAGLGFILEGGKDYPLCPGGKPLSIKKIFRGKL